MISKTREIAEGRRRTTWKVLAVALVVLSVGLGLSRTVQANAASAAQWSGGATISNVIDKSTCVGEVCFVFETGDVQYTGALVGSSHYSSVLTYLPSGVVKDVYVEMFTGTLAGC